MKKALILGAVFFALFFSSCNKTANPSVTNDRPEIYFVQDESVMDDFYIDNDCVYFPCRLVVENRSETSRTISIYGDFSSDATNGLITEKQIKAEDSTTMRSEFVLSPGKNILNIVFVGIHGSKNTKTNRLMPNITIIEIQSDIDANGTE